jgi:hypothetical protein
MQLPFTNDQFLGVFSAYNTAVWPAQIVVVLLALVAVFLTFRRDSPSRGVAAILALLWCWTGVVYHWMFFAAINPAARFFGALCVLQSVLLLVFGVIRDSVRFRFRSDWRSLTGFVFIFYALVAYPAIGYALGHRYPANPTFGAPCPTTIFTIGLLLWTETRLRWYLMLIPFIWSLIGFGAALSLGIVEDTGLLIAGIAGFGLTVFDRRAALAAS